MDDATRCHWPRCSRARSDKYTAVPLCTAHTLVVVDQVRLVNGERPPITTAAAQQAENRRRPGRVYYLRVGELIKVGFSSDLAQRLKAYPPHAVLLTSYPGTPADEEAVHERFAVHRAHRKEWFHPSPTLLAHIEAMKANDDLGGQAAPPKRERRPGPKHNRPKRVVR